MEEMVIAYQDEFKNIRPFCPECGTKMASNGASWRCNNCGKYHVKHPREKKKLEGRPPCPECGNTQVQSRGCEWMCNECGRRFTKTRRRVA